MESYQIDYQFDSVLWTELLVLHLRRYRMQHFRVAHCLPDFRNSTARLLIETLMNAMFPCFQLFFLILKFEFLCFKSLKVNYSSIIRISLFNIKIHLLNIKMYDIPSFFSSLFACKMH